jgi:hypothetical protein
MDELRVSLDGSREVNDANVMKRCKANAQEVRDMILERI